MSTPMLSRRLFSIGVLASAAGCGRGDATPTSDRKPTADTQSAGVMTPANTAAQRADGCSDGCNVQDGTASSCEHGSNAPPTVVAAYRRVPSEQVCMRSNRFQNRPQLSTQVDGRTYFGCCAGCTKGLANDLAARTAKDPVSGNTVDKATAVIGARADGSVAYFESDDTFARAGGV